MSAPSVTTIDFRTLVYRADRDYARDSVNVVQYQFSNGRTFLTRIVPGQEYAWIGTGT